MTDIVPELLAMIQRDFRTRHSESETISRISDLIRAGQATFEEANEYAVETGRILSTVFKAHISADVLPDGKMYYNIAERILNDTLGTNHELISTAAAEIQTSLNLASSLHIKGIKAPINQDRIDGLIDKISEADDFKEVAWALDEPVVNFSQSIIDDTVHINADKHAKLGLKPRIVRTSVGNCCDWCNKLAGSYVYPDVPLDVYKRHRFCRCIVTYYPGDGRRQDVHTKKWRTRGGKEQ